MFRKLIVPVIFFLLFCISLLSYTKAPVEDHSKNNGLAWEEYEPAYFLKFQSVKDIIDSADSRFTSEKVNTILYYNYIAGIVRKRFYHGYSHYSLAENTPAALAGKLFWDDLSAIVIPDDIMKHPMAACSQQAMVLMEIFKRNGVPFRKVAFPHHFTVEAWIENEWRYFDTDMEPTLTKRESLANLIASNKFDLAYSKVGDLVSFKKTTGKHWYGRINELPAQRVTFFHRFCFLLTSRYFLLAGFFLSLSFIINIVNFESGLAYVKLKLAPILSRRSRDV